MYSHRVAVPTTEIHAVDRYLLIAKELGASVDAGPQFRFRRPSQDVTALRDLFRRKGIDLDAPWVAMNVSARWQTKRWPAESFAAVATQLAARGIGPLVVIGGPDDCDVVDVTALRRALLDPSIGPPLEAVCRAAIGS